MPNWPLMTRDLDGIRGNLDQILSASKRSRDLVKQILTFGRKREGQRKALRLTPLIEETVQLLRGSLPSTVRIKTDIRTASDTILGDASQIQQVLMNLATNAAQAMAQDGTLAIRLSEKTFVEGEQLPDQDLRPGRYLKLTVRDTGTGIPADIQKRIFDPFFTTKEPGKGTRYGAGRCLRHREEPWWCNHGLEQDGQGNDLQYLLSGGRRTCYRGIDHPISSSERQ